MQTVINVLTLALAAFAVVSSVIVGCGDSMAIKSIPPCLDGQDRQCVPDDPRVARCGLGVSHCVESTWGPCAPSRLPSVEVCNGLDDDCDGQIDLNAVGTGVPCDPPEPHCSPGVVACRNGRLVCVDWTRREPEVCDGRDNDCNGVVDDIAPVSCYGSWFAGTSPGGPPPEADRGECRRGHARCVAGIRVCDGAIYPAARDCSTRDNDCDGVQDSTDNGPDVDIVAAVDMSGSMAAARPDGVSALAVIADRLRGFAWNHRGSARIRLGLVFVPGSVDGQCELASDLASPEAIGPLIGEVAKGNNSSREPTIECVRLAANGELRISWRPRATRFYLSFSDEEPHGPDGESAPSAALITATVASLQATGITYYGWHRLEDWSGYAPLADRTSGRLYPLDNSVIGRDLSNLLDPLVACR